MKKGNALNQIILRTTVALTIISVLTFSTIFYFSNKQFEAKRDEKIAEITDISKETLAMTQKSFSKIEREFDERMYYVTEAIAQDLSTKDVTKLTPEELKALAKARDVDEISLWKLNPQSGDERDISVFNSSDPNEIGLNSKGWGEWNNSFRQLLAGKKVTNPDGWAKNEKYWIGPVSISDIYRTYFKYANYAATDKNGLKYVLDPWKSPDVTGNSEKGHYFSFKYDNSPNELIDKIIKDNKSIEDISVINVVPYIKAIKGDTLVSNPFIDLPVIYGKNKFVLENKDITNFDKSILEKSKKETLTTIVSQKTKDQELKNINDQLKSTEVQLMNHVGFKHANASINFTKDGQKYTKKYIWISDDAFKRPQILTIVMNDNDQVQTQQQLILILIITFLAALVTIFVVTKFVNKKYIKELENEKERLGIAENFKRTIELLPNAIYEYRKDSDGNIINVYNEGARAEELGLTTSVVVGKNLNEIYADEYYEVAKESFDRAFSGEVSEFMDLVNERVFHNIVKPVYDENNNIIKIAGYATDVTERKKAEDKIKHIAYHDNLTDLANRTLFNIKLNEAVNDLNTASEDEKLAVMMIDLDNFKKVNDTLGHDVGDILLIETANRIKSCLRRHYDLAARMGGDEFTIMLPKAASHKDIEDVAKRVLESLQLPLDVNGVNIMEQFRVTASIGIAVAPEHGMDATTIFKNADIAMYHAKKNGKNNYKIFSEELTPKSE